MGESEQAVRTGLMQTVTHDEHSDPDSTVYLIINVLMGKWLKSSQTHSIKCVCELFPVSLNHGSWDLVQEFQQGYTNILNQRMICVCVSLCHNKDWQKTYHLPGTTPSTLCILNNLIFTATIWASTSNIPILQMTKLRPQEIKWWSNWHS